MEREDADRRGSTEERRRCELAMPVHSMAARGAVGGGGTGRFSVDRRCWDGNRRRQSKFFQSKIQSGIDEALVFF
jgi:hypothetical protein